MLFNQYEIKEYCGVLGVSCSDYSFSVANKILFYCWILLDKQSIIDRQQFSQKIEKMNRLQILLAPVVFFRQNQFICAEEIGFGCKIQIKKPDVFFMNIRQGIFHKDD